MGFRIDNDNFGFNTPISLHIGKAAEQIALVSLIFIIAGLVLYFVWQWDSTEGPNRLVVYPLVSFVVLGVLFSMAAALFLRFCKSTWETGILAGLLFGASFSWMIFHAVCFYTVRNAMPETRVFVLSHEEPTHGMLEPRDGAQVWRMEGIQGAPAQDVRIYTHLARRAYARGERLEMQVHHDDAAGIYILTGTSATPYFMPRRGG